MPSSTRMEVFEVINGERSYQEEKWGPGENQGHSVPAWITFMQVYLDRAAVAATKTTQWEALHEIRKVAALAVSCMEVHGAPFRND